METKLPIGVQDFEKLITSGYKYVDKTAAIYKIANNYNVCFLSRPRRFGKSLLVSTLKAFFLGKKGLFKGLAIDSLEQDWVEYPVLHLDLNSGNYKEESGLNDVLNYTLSQWELDYGKGENEVTTVLRFIGLIKRAYKKTGRKVVILVDEYDKPLISTISDIELQNRHRTALKDFYSVLKTCDEYIRFSFLTGVTKFSKVSIFSDLNNLEDISGLVEYYDICGISEGELKTQFHAEVKSLSEDLNCSIEKAYHELKEHYDGYRFSSKTKRGDNNIDGIYNPFSLLNALKHRILDSYWFETGTPTFLIEKIVTENYDPKDLEEVHVSNSELSVTNKEDLSLIQYLFQTGYLTIKEFDKEFSTYTLGYPNKEVRQGFVECLLPLYTPSKIAASEFRIDLFVKALREGDIDGFMRRLQTFLSSCPYELIAEQERHVQNVIYLLSTLCGFYCKVESHTNKGRIDMTIKTEKNIYIFELKYDLSAKDALNQIKEKGYAEKYAADGRKIICVGINYSSTERNINEWLIS